MALIEANQLPAEQSADVCVVGAGAAGIAIALELQKRSKLRIALIVGGGPSRDERYQALNRVKMAGIPTDDPEGNNIRGLGGTTSLWGGYCRPLEPIDFEARPWVPSSGWPIARADIEPFLPRAHELLEVSSAEYDPETLLTPSERERKLSIRTPGLENFVINLSPPTRFGERYKGDLESAQRLEAFVGACAVELLSDPGAQRVTAVRCKTLEGKEIRVNAECVVVACGAIQTARLLLASRGANTRGIGNDKDLVGRYFLQHPQFGNARLLTTKAGAKDALGRGVEGRPAGVASATGAAAQREDSLLNTWWMLGYDPELDDAQRGRLLSPLHARVRAWRHFFRRPDVDRDLSRVVAHVDGTRGDLGMPAQAFTEIHIRPEQIPNPDSRITLSEERDLLGMPTVVMDWQLSGLDWEMLARGIRRFGREIGALGLGRVHSSIAAMRQEAAVYLHGGHHHAGTTRMSDDPSRGVVDRDCRVHGVENLFVAGGSVFPTNGYANPTLTVVALALRLAEHIARTRSSAAPEVHIAAPVTPIP